MTGKGPAPVEAPKPGDEPPRVLEGAEASGDPLLGCLEFLTRYYQRPYSAAVLRAGLPLAGPNLSPSLFVRAAARAGLVARVVQRPFDSLTDLDFPVVASLGGDQACVVLERKGSHVMIMMPESGGGVHKAPLTTLLARYAGYVIHARPEYHLEPGAERERLGEPRGWFWGVLWRNQSLYLRVALAALLINVFALALPLFIMTVYDRVIPNNAVDTLWVLTTGIAVVFAFDFIVKSLRGHYVDTAGRRADVALSSRIFDHVLDIQMAARPQSAGGFANTLREFESVRDFFTSATVAALVDLPFLFLFIAVIWMIGGSIALVPAIAVPAVIAVGLLVQIPLGRAVRAAFGQAVARHGVLFETIGGLETIKSVGADSRMRHLWEVSVSQSARTSARSRALSLMAINFTGFAQQVAGVGIVIYGVFLIGAGALSVGALIACVILNGRAVASLAQIAQLLVRWHQARTSLFDRGVRRGGSVLVVTRYRRPGHHRPGPGDSHQPGAGRAKPRGRDSARHPRRRGRHRRTRPGPASHRRHQLRGELSRKPGPLLQHACGDRAP